MKRLAERQVSMIWSGQHQLCLSHFSFQIWYFIYERNMQFYAVKNDRICSSNMRPNAQPIANAEEEGEETAEEKKEEETAEVEKKQQKKKKRKKKKKNKKKLKKNRSRRRK